MKLSNEANLIVILLAINSMFCNAQIKLNIPDGATIKSVSYISNLDRFNTPTYEYTIEGTPYSNDVYSKGNVHLKNVSFSNIEMRYNIFYDQIEFKDQDSVFAIFPDMNINKISIGTQTFVVDSYELKGKRIPGYFLRLDSGMVTLLTKMTVTFKDRELKPIAGEIPAKYQRIPDIYYLKFGNSSLIKIRSISKIIDELPNRKREMEDFARSEKISVNNLKELTKFINYYNSLQ